MTPFRISVTAAFSTLTGGYMGVRSGSYGCSSDEDIHQFLSLNQPARQQQDGLTGPRLACPQL